MGLDDERTRIARTLGVFDAPIYNTIGEPYEQKRKPNERFAGKQFEMCFPKTGKTKDTLFAKDYGSLYLGERFDDKYHPKGDGKKGFLLSSAPKRDEFCTVVASEQRKETLRKEALRLRSQDDEHKGILEEHEHVPNPKQNEQFCPTEFTYDLLKEATSKRTYCVHCTRDVYYCRHTSPERTAKSVPLETLPGHEWLSSAQYGQRLENSVASLQSKPSRFAHRPIIAQSFYRATGIP